MSTKLEHDWYPEPLPANVSIGERCWVYSSFAFLHYQSRRERGVAIGHDTGVYNGTFFDLGPDGSVEVGDYSTLVGAIINSNAPVKIGNYVFVAHEVVIADDAMAVPGRAVERPREIVIEDNVWIGARAVILGGVRIGEGSIIGAASVVNFDVEPYSLVAGNPARVVKKLR